MKYIILRLFSIAFTFLIFFIYLNHFCEAADLDDLYRPLLEKGRYLYKGEAYYYSTEEEGIHGDAAYDKLESSPDFNAFYNCLRFSPLHSLELALGFNGTFSEEYNRSTYNTSGSLDRLQEYDLNHTQDYKFNLRKRNERAELYIDILEKRQKGKWDLASLPNPADYFSYIRTHYEDFKLGYRYLSEARDFQYKSNLSKLRRSPLQDNQINIAVELGYKSGKLKRTSFWCSGGTYTLNFLHNLRPHFIPRLSLRYGLSDDLELESGLFYTTPFKYKYEYKLFYPSGDSLFITGTYKLKDNFYLPVKLSYRPKDNFVISLSSDFNFINQRLDYWLKEKNGTLTIYPSKKLSYYNTKPTLKLSYLYDNNKEIQEDEFSSLAKDLLLKNQFLLELRFQKDITHLSKNSNNGSQNIIDPYNVFLYPPDNFVAGSEYATFFCGNNSTFATNVLPQNYNLFEASFIYGLSDSLNLGLRTGYRSSNSLHHFTMGTIAEHLKSRFYKFRSHLFFDFLYDWRITKNSLLSLKSHFVPNYTTFLDYEAYPKQFKSKNKYFEIALALQILF